MNQDIHEQINNATKKELETDLKNMIGLDPMERKQFNREKHLLSHADPYDRPIFEEMDHLLKEKGSNTA